MRTLFNSVVRHFPIWFYVLAMHLPVALFSLASYKSTHAYQQVLGTALIDGVVVSFEETRKYDRVLYRPIVEYRVGRRVYSCHDNAWSNSPYYTICEPVTVRYKSDDPK